MEEITAQTQFKLIGISNFGKEDVSDILIKDNMTEEDAQIEADLMNYNAEEYYNGDQVYFYKPVSADYKLMVLQEL